MKYAKPKASNAPSTKLEESAQNDLAKGAHVVSATVDFAESSIKKKARSLTVIRLLTFFIS